MWLVVGKILFNLLIVIGQKTGVLNSVEATGIKAEHDFVSALTTLKTYPQYPTGRNGQSG